MMKKIMSVVMALVVGAAFAGTVTVEGKACVKRRPDGMALQFSLEAIDKDMAKSRDALAEKRSAVRAAMNAVGVADEEVTDSNIRMNPEFHNEDEKGNELSEYADKGKRVFCGYKHRMTCEFRAKLDLERLEKIYLALVKTKCAEDLRVDFHIMETQSLQDEARRLAVVNARTVAEELCKAASATLGEVKEINYNARNYGAGVCRSDEEVANILCVENEPPLLPSINVDEIVITDSVEIRWEIK